MTPEEIIKIRQALTYSVVSLGVRLDRDKKLNINTTYTQKYLDQAKEALEAALRLS